MGSTPTTFVAVVFDTVTAAEVALSTAHDLSTEPDVAVHDAAVVVRTEAGRIELHQTREIAAGEAVVGGGSAGLVVGLLLGLPVGGALLGLAGGALLGLRDTGLPDDRLRALGTDLAPGQAMLCVLVDSGGVARAREALGRYGAVRDVALSSESGSP